jgi:hypothetical protein
VVVSATTLPPELAAFQRLPRDGKPIMGRSDHEDALLEVIQELLDTIKYRQMVPAPGEATQRFARTAGHGSTSPRPAVRTRGPRACSVLRGADGSSRHEKVEDDIRRLGI